MPYDPTAPTVGTSLRVSNPVLLADKAFLKNGLEREHAFVADETAGVTGEHLRHSMGSGRVWIYDNAIPLTTVICAATYSQAKAHATGYVVIDVRLGRVFYCQDGALDTWVEPARVGGNFQVGGVLSVQGAGHSTLTGVLDVAGGITVAPAGKIIVPVGESVLVDTTPVTPQQMNPFLHNARHRMGGVSGAWVKGADYLPGGLVATPLFVQGAAVLNLTNAYQTLATLALNLTGRTVASLSHVLVFASYTVRRTTATSDQFSGRVQVGGVSSAFAPLGWTAIQEAHANNVDSASWIDYFALGPALHSVTLQARVETNITGGDSFKSSLMIIDLGETV